MSVKSVRLNTTILVPNHIHSSDMLSVNKHKGLALEIRESGVFGTVGDVKFLIPFSNIQLIVFAEDADGTKP